MNTTNPTLPAIARQALHRLEIVTDTIYPGRNGRWWYEEWAALRLCEGEHPWMKSKAQPCAECSAAIVAVCDERDAEAARGSTEGPQPRQEGEK